MHTVWFIRHAESEANSGLPSSDIVSIPLTERGRAQAIYIARAFDTPPDLIVTSPYIRTRITAEPTIERFPQTPCEEWPIQEFTCLAPARVANTTQAQRAPMAEAYWDRCEPDYVDGTDAESFNNLIQRIHAMLDRIHRQEPGKFLAIFTHAQFLRALVWTLLGGTGMREFRHFDRSLIVPNSSILKIDFGDELRMSNFITAHLPSDIVTGF